MQCSGIHRSLGVHISKVRSTTLDTWLPEQVAFMQSVGNQKSNSYWEAELSPSCDRSEIARFIRAKYEEKKWIPKGAGKSALQLGVDDCFGAKILPAAVGVSNLKKTRKLSLEEEVLTKHMAQITPPAPRTRGASMDMNMKVGNLMATGMGPPPTKDFQPTQRIDGGTKLYNLLYSPDQKQGTSNFSAPTSESWATFDCKKTDCSFFPFSLPIIACF
uniref:Arf-GAP domain-containing protein n=2 Tax=Kalanchoe fedtschenkoi TaxID=63787 RepID=A0A7N0VDA5_KALFE